MAMKKFLEPELELETFATEEIVTTSDLNFGAGDMEGAQDWD